MAVTIRHVRLRLNVFNTTRPEPRPFACCRRSSTIQRLNLHPSLQQIAELRSGLVLICGATGTGKSTTIAAIIDEINRNRTAHIVTLEDPIEYRFTSSSPSWSSGPLAHASFERLHGRPREDPDVIVVGELRSRRSCASPSTPLSPATS
ncbi:MAG: Flp pilus assembly complex ATPase component TadA [Syntrophaceae bacterium]|nr:Flp pilus assembly complex ATPase component TadA [Syntrophaceae bacterium]